MWYIYTKEYYSVMKKNNNSRHLRQAKNKSQTYCRGGRGRGIKQGRESKGDYSDGSWVT